MVSLVISTLIAFAVILVVVLIKTNRNYKAMDHVVSNVPGFVPTRKYMHNDGTNGSGIAFDEHSMSLCLITGDCGTLSSRVVRFDDIISSEIVEDGAALLKTSRTSQVGGALVGGALFGGAGAVVGALSGKQKVCDKVRRLELLITLNDLQRPLHNVVFIDAETDRNGFAYRNAIQSAREWQALLDVLIKRADQANT